MKNNLYMPMNEGGVMDEDEYYSNLRRFEDTIYDLKYLNRLNFPDFKELLFNDSVGDYAEEKWRLFNNDKLLFMWSCDDSKIEILYDYIESCKYKR